MYLNIISSNISKNKLPTKGDLKMIKNDYTFNQTRKNKRRAGFTLIEMLIVVGIIGLLLAMLIPRFHSLREQTKNRTNVANGQKLLDMLESYYLQNGSYPIEATNTTSIQALLTGGLTSFVATDTTNYGTATKFVNPFTGATYGTGTAGTGDISVTFKDGGILLKVYGAGTDTIKEIDGSQ